MEIRSRRAVLGALGRIGLAGSAAGLGGPAAASRQFDGESTLRFVNAVPTSPRIVAIVGGEVLAPRLRYGQVSRYRPVDAGRRRVRIGAPDGRTLFRGALAVDEGPETAVALPRRGPGEQGESPLRVIQFADDEPVADEDAALVRLVHASPDALAVDVTRRSGGVVFDDLSYGEAPVAALPAGEHALQIRPATRFDVAPVVRTVSVDLDEGTRYSAFAVGYLTPGDEPVDAPLRLVWRTAAATG